MLDRAFVFFRGVGRCGGERRIVARHFRMLVAFERFRLRFRVQLLLGRFGRMDTLFGLYEDF